ncbi:YdbL family protein [Henriciella sp. AS95]|uniref:YdbL family protein n=1 Tax=Henriciella sp. AS95 TaxID=3135782 RepID=UPI00317969A1
MTRFFKLLSAVALMTVATITMAAPAQAADPQIETAKEQGVVGERIDGYLGIVDGGADASLIRRVQDINNKRRAAYDDLANQTGTTPEQVARVTGEKLVAGAASGEFVMDDSGAWTQK